MAYHDPRRRARTRTLRLERFEPRQLLAVVQLEPLADNTIYEPSATVSESNGAGAFMFVGTAGPTSGASVRRSLIKFDVAGSVPAGATIDDVKLTLNMSRTSSGPQTIALHRLIADWGEGSSDAAANEGRGAEASTNDATWRHRFFESSLWNTEGGDFEAVASASLSVNNLGKYTWTGAGLIADADFWLDNPTRQFGWILVGNEQSTRQAKRFDTRESAVAGNRPRLEVTYTLANSPPHHITLDGNTVPEDADVQQPVAVGVFQVEDADGGDVHSLELVAGEGGDDNERFQLVQQRLELKAGVQLDHETKPLLHVRVRATDRGGLALERTFEIAVSDVNEPPELARPLTEQFVVGGNELTYSFPEDTFTDVDAGNAFTYSASLLDGSPLPDWLVFHATTRTFQGTPQDADAALIPVRVTARDSGTPAAAAQGAFRIIAVSSALPWQNPRLHLDTDGDGVIAPIDVLLIVNELNLPVVSSPATGALPVPSSTLRPPAFFDTSGDNFASAIDVLVIVNELNAPDDEEGEDNRWWDLPIPTLPPRRTRLVSHASSAC